MRSAIACDRCRRSKVKCDNDGPDSNCHQCSVKKHKCVYFTSGSGGARRASTTATTPNGAGKRPGVAGEAPQKRQRKANGPTSNPFIKQEPGLEKGRKPLDSSLLTPKVWNELFEIFQRHYATDLPFLHATTFRKRLGQATGSTHSQPEYSALFLLSFLALTSRFHDGLVQHYRYLISTPESDGPLDTAEYYASEARKHLEPGDHKCLERIQALLMLGLHEWGTRRGAKAYETIQAAITLAQQVGLQMENEADFDNMEKVRMKVLSPDIPYINIVQGRVWNDKAASRDANAIEQEIRRRTFWSCFVLDRHLGVAEVPGRSWRLRVEEVGVTLPSSEEAFRFGRKEKTLSLKESSKSIDTRLQWERDHRDPSKHSGYRNERDSREFNGYNGNDRTSRMPHTTTESNIRESPLSCFIRALVLYNDHMRWTLGGARRKEAANIPPWDHRSRYHMLDSMRKEFIENLPDENRYTLDNVGAHEAQKSLTVFTLTHSAIFLCGITLGREYMPHYPFECDKPKGPLDAPLFPSDAYPLPPDQPDWWVKSAALCFESARGLLDLLWESKELGSLPETPFSAYAAFQTGIVAVYRLHFPQMDPHNRMRVKDGHKADAIQKAIDLLLQMKSKVKMAKQYSIHVYLLDKKIREAGKTYKARMRSLNGASPESANSSNSTQSAGGGLADYIEMESLLKEVSSLMDDDNDLHPIGSEAPDNYKWEQGSEASADLKTIDRTHAAHQQTPASEKPPVTTSSGFTPVNAVNPPSLPMRVGEESTTQISHNNGPYYPPPQVNPYGTGSLPPPQPYYNYGAQPLPQEYIEELNGSFAASHEYYMSFGGPNMPGVDWAVYAQPYPHGR